MQISSRVLIDKNQDLKNVEFRCGDRRVIVDNLDMYEPLSRYIDVDKLTDLMTLKLEDKQRAAQGIRLNKNVTLFEFDNTPSRPHTTTKKLYPYKNNNFQSRSYSAAQKKRK